MPGPASRVAAFPLPTCLPSSSHSRLLRWRGCTPDRRVRLLLPRPAKRRPAGSTPVSPSFTPASGTHKITPKGLDDFMINPAKVSAMIDAIRDRDAKLGDELQARRQGARDTVEAEGFVPEWPAEGRVLGPSPQLVAETIVLRTGRPVLAVSHNEPDLTFTDAESEVWKDRLSTCRSALLPAIRAVGRIELENNPRFDWVGTGWLVKPDVIVTNRHVASEFGKRSGETFVFRQGTGGQYMNASIDFLQEAGSGECRSFRLKKILSIEDEDGPDLAFLQVEGDGLAPEIGLSTGAAALKQMIAAIGYPARDSRIPDVQLMDTIFGDVYDKKRLAPGQIIQCKGDDLEHDCSTLGGNRGSVLLDLASGQALGIHFAGKFLEANYAVPSAVLAERLEAALKGGTAPKPASNPLPDRPATQPQVTATPPANNSGTLATLTCTIPLKVTVEIGMPQTGAPAVVSRAADVPDVPVTEGAPEDYLNREGYNEDFLGEDMRVSLPEVTRDAGQVVEFQFDGETQSVLKYEHFSVVMNRKRRMCFFSAVNINGKVPGKATRTEWRFDPRIDKSLQIMYECYGNPPKFSRGHMTRREDPVWGKSAEAALGNSDSLHVTNATPQMQSFNAPIWLGLEDYALKNARRDKMMISVFTGPILKDNDPIRFGVKIPRSFWKVIAFIHDDTGELTATGYSASQDEQLPEFVFGDYD